MIEMKLEDLKLHLAANQCERAARRARELLYQNREMPLSEKEKSDVYACMETIAAVRRITPSDNPGWHEAALRRMVGAYETEQEST